MEKVKFKKQVFCRRGGVTKGVPLLITYYHLLKSVSTILYKHFYLLHMDKEVKKLFPVAPMVSFKSFIHYRGQWDYLNVTNPDVKYA